MCEQSRARLRRTIVAASASVWTQSRRVECRTAWAVQLLLRAPLRQGQMAALWVDVVKRGEIVTWVTEQCASLERFSGLREPPTTRSVAVDAKEARRRVPVYVRLEASFRRGSLSELAESTTVALAPKLVRKACARWVEPEAATLSCP